MRHPLAFRSGHLRGSDIKAAINLQRLAIDDFGVESASDAKGKIALARSGGTQYNRKRN
jgi:hypothetical protein